MKLNIYKNQTEIAKTYEVEGYDIMYGTVEDILEILDSVEGGSEDDMLKAVSRNRDKLNNLLLDVFPGVTKEELRQVKLKDLIPIFSELFQYVAASFDKSETKN